MFYMHEIGRNFFFLQRDLAHGRDTIVTFTLSGHFERMISRDMENWIYGQ